MDTRADWGRELEGIFLALEQLFGLRVTFSNPKCFFGDTQGNSFIAPGRIFHDVPFCQKRRADHPRCLQHEWIEANRIAAGKAAPFLRQCWKGPMQILVPLKWNGRHVGIIFLGPFDCAGAAAATPGEGLPRYDLARFERDAALLATLAHGIVERTAQAIRFLGKGDRWEKIYALVVNRHAEKLGIADVAKELHLSPSRACHVVRECFGMPFEKVLLEHRLRRTAALLESTDMTLAEIAADVGFSDLYYLSRAFKQARKIPPGAYRAQMRETARRGGGQSPDAAPRRPV
ncbi:MAG: helix-turn-helix domain-containing protein [Lentisphaeria bacterium]|jgi:AraC-like DNA-binding protein